MSQPLERYLAAKPAELGKGPIAVILLEDDIAVDSTLEHALKAGFKLVLALAPDDIRHEVSSPRIRDLRFDTRRPDSHARAVNQLLAVVPEGTWLYYGYGAEYLYFPFSESRHVGEMLAFHTEERRPSMLSYVIDLYAPDLTRDPDGVSLDEPMFDRTGYYALGRKNEEGHMLERQLDFHGGLRWRFEEYIPEHRRRIDRISLFRARKGLRLLEDHRFNIEEYNTYSCPWHHNLTCAVASFRAAKALARNPGSRDEIGSFMWRNSQRFEWSAQQLMDLGLMEPGQWF